VITNRLDDTCPCRVRQIIVSHPHLRLSSLCCVCSNAPHRHLQCSDVRHLSDLTLISLVWSTLPHRRVWRVLTFFAPSYRTSSGEPLSPFTDSYASDYPFSVRADAPISPADLMRIQVIETHFHRIDAITVTCFSRSMLTTSLPSMQTDEI
jgi:hypothetical protein